MQNAVKCIFYDIHSLIWLHFLADAANGASEAHIKLASIHRQKADTPKVVHHLQQAIKLAPNKLVQMIYWR